MIPETGIKETNISLALDSYTDIFSDFDPRPYNSRALSVDFLQECIRAARDKQFEGIELRLLIPKGQRNKKAESLIKKRLREHFNKHCTRLIKEKNATKRHGVCCVLIGAALLILAADVRMQTENFWRILLFVTAEPAGWFTIWTGFEKLFLQQSHHLEKREFYTKMSKADIRFESY